jgi:peptidoglycan-associated lipoprotein
MRKFLLVAALVAVAPACKKKTPEVAAEVPVTTAPAPRQTPPPTAVQEAAAQVAANFSRINFPFDSSELDAESRRLLAANAEILKRFATIRVEIQGHADERGTTDYNLALGQRRADAVKSVLLTNGATSNQLTTVSYGEERPAQRGAGETVWAQNRRAEFRITADVPGVVGTVAM